MFCKNCGKEMKNEDAFCRECGAKAESNDTAQANPIDAGAFQTAVASSGDTVAVKKKSKVKWIVIGVFVVSIIIVIACAVGGSSDVIESNSETGASFNCTIEEVIERYNSNVDEHFVNDSGLSKSEYEEFKEQFKLKKSYFTQESENKYFCSSSGDVYGITIQVDDNGNVYFVDMVWKNNLSKEESSAIMILLRGLILSIQPSKDYDTVKQIIIDTDNTNGILQKDNVKYMATYESNCTRFSAIALFDE